MTTKDIKKIIEAVGTKQEHKQDLENLEDKFDKKFDDVMTKMDAVYKEVKDMRQEQVMHLRGAHDRIQGEIDSTKSRLKKVESALNL